MTRILYTPNGVDEGTDINFSPDYKANPNSYVEVQALPRHRAYDCIRVIAKCLKWIPEYMLRNTDLPEYLVQHH